MTSPTVKLYHPRGPEVTIPLAGSDLLGEVGRLLDAGWLAHAPGLEAGESKDVAAWVVLRSKQNQDNTETPIVDLYGADQKYSFLSVYLNRPEDERAFEAASGLRLDDLKPYVGAGKLERGANRQTDQFFARLARPVAVVHKPNPKFDPNETDAKKKKPKRVFVRWDHAAPAPAPQPAAAPQAPPPGANVPDHPAIVAAYVSTFKACASRRNYDEVCGQIVNDVRANRLTERDRAAIRPHAEACSARFPAQPAAR